MAKKKIPDDVRHEVEDIVNRFNEEVIRDAKHFFIVRFRGAYIYLDRFEGDIASQRGRLKYSGDISSMEFSIFKYSSETYDPDEWFFPGSNFINGTVGGALKACVEAYPQSRIRSSVIEETQGFALMLNKLMSKFGL